MRACRACRARRERMPFMPCMPCKSNHRPELCPSLFCAPLRQARAFTDGTIKKLAPMLLGGILIVVQKFTGAGAFEIVQPMSFYALAASIGLMPLVRRGHHPCPFVSRHGTHAHMACALTASCPWAPDGRARCTRWHRLPDPHH